jgi:hypothetical protein
LQGIHDWAKSCLTTSLRQQRCWANCRHTEGIQYLGRYTHRVAISNHRLVSFTDGKVTLRWRDSAHNNEQKLMTLPIDEFLRTLERWQSG